MKVLYMLHRYHTNQISIMKGWVENGHELCILSQYSGKIEDYTYVKPTVIGYSLIYRFFDYLWVKIIRRKDPFAMNLRIKIGFPPLFKCAKYIRKFNPDVVIIRERSVYTIFVTAICRFFGYPSILFDLSPLWDKRIKTDLPHRIVHRLTPKLRITPVKLRGIDFSGLIEMPYSYFAPFLAAPMIPPEEKQYFTDGRINIMSVGKYQERKNHILLLEAIKALLPKYQIHLTIAGEVSDNFHREYYKMIVNYLKEHQLEANVTLHLNLNRDEMNLLYRNTDLHIQPSSEEPAGSTITEAMSFSVPVISGSDNGTASYITPGVSGEVFNDRDKDDLINKIEAIISDRNNIPRMGKAAYESILENHQFENYFQVIKLILGAF